MKSIDELEIPGLENFPTSRNSKRGQSKSRTSKHSKRKPSNQTARPESKKAKNKKEDKSTSRKKPSKKKELADNLVSGFGENTPAFFSTNI